MKRDLLARLRAGETLMLDGATGTMLQAAGLPRGGCPELWNETEPAKVKAIPAAYAAAGSDIVLTNTFGGNRLRLKEYDLADKVVHLCTLGVQLARAAVGEDVLIAASMGPCGQTIEPYGDLSFEEAKDVYAEAARALAAAGADAIEVETFLGVMDAQPAIAAVKDNTKLPVVCTIVFERGRSYEGDTPADAAKRLRDLGADVVGANCGNGPADYLPVMEQMRAAVEGFLVVKPNAGMPRLVGDDIVYDVTPGEMAQWAERFKAIGVNIIGGCCGTTPEHIQAMAQRVKGSLRW
ncbi:MAG: homocysteine S-methyltransferase family protein, partial [Abditibacteriales bacterium]|nr:homocysteine S-methyltransferase family protein [Abditibacteriales bacterium]